MEVPSLNLPSAELLLWPIFLCVTLKLLILTSILWNLGLFFYRRYIDDTFCSSSAKIIPFHSCNTSTLSTILLNFIWKLRLTTNFLSLTTVSVTWVNNHFETSVYRKDGGRTFFSYSSKSFCCEIFFMDLVALFLHCSTLSSSKKILYLILAAPQHFQHFLGSFNISLHKYDSWINIGASTVHS